MSLLTVPQLVKLLNDDPVFTAHIIDYASWLATMTRAGTGRYGRYEASVHDSELMWRDATLRRKFQAA